MCYSCTMKRKAPARSNRTQTPQKTPREKTKPRPGARGGTVPDTETTVPSQAPTLTATHIYNYLACPHRVHLDGFGDKRRMDPENDFEKLLWEKGVAHEKNVLQELGLAVSEISWNTAAEWEEKTLRLMRQGDGFIYQGLLSAPRMRGNPDLLEKVEGTSLLGSHYYIPVELKSGTAYENEEEGAPKKYYALQLCCYADILGKVQGRKPETGRIIDGDFRRVTIELAPFRETYERLLSEIEALLSGNAKSEPCISSTCGQCHWRTFCLDWARRRDDVSLVRKINRPKRDILRAHGVRTVGELAALEGKKMVPVEGISEKALGQFVKRAVVMKHGRAVLHSAVEVPTAGLELYFDIEVEPMEDVCYLYGIVEVKGSKGAPGKPPRSGEGGGPGENLGPRRTPRRYVSFFADSPGAEEEAWKEFWDYVAGLGDYHVYYYSQYEKRELKKRCECFSCDATLFENFFDHSTDLYALVDRYTDWPSHSYSIKAVSKYLGFKYSDADPGGLKAAKWYIDYVANPQGEAVLKEKILQYNREDCEAMILVKDWLTENSEELRRRGNE